MGVLDFFFPKQCVVCKTGGAYLCSTCFATLSFDAKSICIPCGRGSLDGLTHPVCKKRYSIDGVFCSLSYTHAVRKMIFRFKYAPFLTDLGKLFEALLYESLIQNESFMHILPQQESYAFVPIPLSAQKLRKRGYNQAHMLARSLSTMFDLPVVDCLERVRDTKPLFGLKREERREAMKNAFQIKQDVIPNLFRDLQVQHDSASVFLVDDLLTTGTTLAEAAFVLKKSGIQRVWGVCFAGDRN